MLHDAGCLDQRADLPRRSACATGHGLVCGEVTLRERRRRGPEGHSGAGPGAGESEAALRVALRLLGGRLPAQLDDPPTARRNRNT